VLVKGEANVVRTQEELARAGRTLKPILTDEEKLIKKLNKGIQGSSASIGDVGRRVFIWGAMGAAVFAVTQKIREAYEFTVKLDTAMGELKKVLPKATDFGFLKEKAFSLSIEFGRDPLEVVDILRVFAQAGLSAAQSISAARTALLGLNTTGAETKQIIDAIIGANKIFGMSFENSASLMDKIQKVQAETAVEARDLVQAITGIGPAVTAINGDMNSLFAIVGALGEASRISGKEASNVFKRVLSMLVSKEGVAALGELGVAVYRTKDEFRPLLDIFSDLYTALQSATEVEKENIAMVLAQVRHYAKFQAFIQQMPRALEINKKAQESFGAAIDANAIVLETYAKRTKIASTETMQFMSTLTSAGYLNNLVATQESLGAVSSGLNKIPGGVYRVVTSFVMISAAVLAARKMLIGFDATRVGVMKGVSTFSLVFGEASKKLTEPQSKIASQITGLAKWAGRLSILGAVLFTVAPEIASFIKKLKEQNKALEEGTKILDEFAKSLNDISFSNLDVFSSQTKFSLINTKVFEVTKSFKQNKITAKEAADEIAMFLSGKNVANLTADEITKVIDLIEMFNTKYSEVQRTMAGEVLAEPMKRYKESFKDLISFMEKSTADSNIQEQFMGMFASSGNLDSGIKKFFKLDLAELETELEKAKELWRRNVTTMGGNGEEAASMYGGAAETAAMLRSSPGIANLTKTIELKKQAIALEEKYNEVKLNSNKIAAAAAQGKDATALITARKKSVEEAAKITLDAIGMEKIYAEIFKDNQELGTKLGFLKTTNVAGDLNDIADAAIRLINADLKQALKPSDFVQVSGLLGNITNMLKEGAKEGKAWAVSFDVVAFISGIKQSSGELVAGFNTQLEMMSLVERQASLLGNSYDRVAEHAKFAENAVTELVNRQRDNTIQLSSLGRELKETQRILFLNESWAFGDKFLAEDEVNELKDKIASISARLYSLREIQKEDAPLFKEAIAAYSKILRLTKDIQEYRKLESGLIEHNTAMLNAMYGQQIKLNSLTSESSLLAWSKNEKIQKSILDSQIAQLDTKLALSIIDNEQYRTEKQKLIASYELEKLNSKLTIQYEMAEEAMSRISKRTDGIGDAFKTLLTDTEGWVESLSKDNGFSSIKKLFSSIYSSMAQSDAEAFIVWFKDKASNVITGANKDVARLQSVLDSKGLTDNIEESVLSSGKKLGESIGDSLYQSFLAVEKDIIPRIAASIGGALEFDDSFIVKLVRGELKAGAKAVGEDKKVVAELSNTVSKTQVKDVSPQSATTALITDFSNALDNNSYITKIVSDELTTMRLASKKTTLDEVKVSDVTQQKTTPLLSDLLSVNRTSLGMEQLYGQQHVALNKELNEIMKEEVVTNLEGIKRLSNGKAALQGGVGTPELDAAIAKLKEEELKNALNGLAKRVGSLASRGIAVAITKGQGKSTEGVNVGSDIGGVLGSAGAVAVGLPPGVGMGVGELLGGVLGGIFGGSKEKEEVASNIERIEKNTAQLVDKLSPEIINAPANFSLPSGQGYGGGAVTIINQINASGGNIGQDTATLLAKQLNDLYSRGSTNISVMDR
jgi:TP901 family phage tail tape measure protein